MRGIILMETIKPSFCVVGEPHPFSRLNKPDTLTKLVEQHSQIQSNAQ